jgi:hypothetical protein
MDALLGLTASLPTWVWLVLVIVGCLFGIIVISHIGNDDNELPEAHETAQSGFPRPHIIHTSRVDADRIAQEMQHARKLINHPHLDAVLYTQGGRTDGAA